MDERNNPNGKDALAGLKILLLSYYFPPLSSAGGHRTGALTRHLRELGADVTVVTAKHGLDVSDPALLERIPADVRVVRVPSLEGAAVRRRLRDRFKHQRLAPAAADRAAAEPVADHGGSGSAIQRAVLALAWGISAARVMQPWGLRRWIYARNAAKALRAEIKRDRPDVLVASLGPMSQTWSALRATRGTDVPVVFDFRDLWTTAPEYYTSVRALPIGKPALWIDRRLERWALKRASYFIANHDHMAKTLATLEPRAAQLVTVIPNGYEDDGFAAIDVARAAAGPAAEGLANPKRAVVRSVGTTYIYTVGALLRACEQLPGESAAKLRIELIGPYYDENAQVSRADGRSRCGPRCCTPTHSRRWTKRTCCCSFCATCRGSTT
jgi:glycosyltransferase involved in cell wall biosynthesis